MTYLCRTSEFFHNPHAVLLCDVHVHALHGCHSINIAQLTVILMNSLVIMENVNLKAMSVMGTMTVEIIVMKKDVVSM